MHTWTQYIPNLLRPEGIVDMRSPKLFVCAECIVMFPEAPEEAYSSPLGFKDTDQAKKMRNEAN